MKYAETGTGRSHSTAFSYDTLNNLTQRKQITNGDVFTTNYTYDDDNRPATVVNGNTSKAYTYDSYGRLSQQSTSVSGSPILTESFTYYTGTGGTSGQLRQYASAFTDRLHSVHPGARPPDRLHLIGNRPRGAIRWAGISV